MDCQKMDLIETSGTGDHIPQGVPKVVVSEPVSARAAEQGSDRH